MAEIIKSIEVDVAKQNTFKAIVAKQGDSSSRFLNVTLLNEGVPIQVEATAAVAINFERIDGESAAYAGTVNSDSTITVPLTSWMLQLEGQSRCSISVVSNGARLTSTSFYVTVEHAEYCDDDIIEDDDPTIVEQIMEVIGNENQRIANETTRQSNEASRQSAETDRTTAESGRVSAETARATAESGRASAEINRADAETLRASAESTRQSNETSRQSAESNRADAEAIRVANEATRQSAETARETASATAVENANAATESANAAAERVEAVIEAGTIPVYDEDADKDYTCRITVKNGYPVIILTEAETTN